MSTGIPPGVSDLIAKIKDPAYDFYQRDNVCASLERIVSACNEAIVGFNREKNAPRGKKR